MLTIQDILQKADELILEVQENSITPPRVGELIYALAELIQQGAAGGTTIGIRKLSELEDVELAGLKNLNILQLLGEKWRNVEFDIVKLNNLASIFMVDDQGRLVINDGFVSNALSHFNPGFWVGDFTPGMLGTGARLIMDNGISKLEVDQLVVRMTATFFELVISKLKHIGGQLVLSPASMKCLDVEEYTTYYRCYMDTGGGKSVNEFVLNDQARCQVFTGTGLKFYWRLVVGVGADYIDLSKSDAASGSGAPVAGDDIVQLGNRTDASRQSAQVLSTVGDDAPSYKQYAGINSYTLTGCEQTVLSPAGNKIIGDVSFRRSDGSYSTVDNAINKIQIGGRNLILNSKAGLTNSQYQVLYGNLSEEWVPGKTYTISLKGSVNAGNKFGIYRDGGWQLACWLDYDAVSALYKATFVCPDVYPGNTELKIISIYNYPQATATAATITWIKLEKGEKATDWTPAPEDIQAEIDDARDDAATALANYQNTVNGLLNALEDGVLSDAERTGYANWLNVIARDKSEIQASYQLLYDNTRVNATLKANLLAAKNALYGSDWTGGAYAALVTAINAVVTNGDNLITAEERTTLNNAFVAYNASISTYSQRVLEAQNGITGALSGEITDAANDAATALANYQNTVNGLLNALEDGVLSDAERTGYANWLNVIARDKSEIQASYQLLYDNTRVDATLKANLLAAKNALYGSDWTGGAYAALVTAINAVVTNGDNLITAEERTTLSTAFGTYNTALGTYAQRVREAENGITGALGGEIENAQTTANDAYNEASIALGQIVDMGADGKLTPVEKLQTRQIWNSIAQEYTKNITQAGVYGVSTTTYTTKYNALNSYLNLTGGLLVDMITTSSIVRSVYETRFNEYYAARQELLNNIVLAAKAYSNALINNLYVGGVNLIIGSTRTVTADAQGNGLYMVIYGADSTSPSATIPYLENGQKYVFSVGKIERLAGTTTNVRVLLYDFVNNTNGPYTDTLTLSTSRQFFSFTVPATGYYSLLIYSGIYPNFASNSIRYSQLMLQKGEVYTQFTESLRHLTEAFEGSTDIQGGVIATNLLMMKDADSNVTAGMSGLDDNIWLWTGGNYGDAGEEEVVDLFRKDGSGFLAGKKIGWDVNGGMNIGEFKIEGSAIVGYDEDSIRRLKVHNGALTTLTEFQTNAADDSGYSYDVAQETFLFINMFAEDIEFEHIFKSPRGKLTIPIGTYVQFSAPIMPLPDLEPTIFSARRYVRSYSIYKNGIWQQDISTFGSPVQVTAGGELDVVFNLRFYATMKAGKTKEFTLSATDAGYIAISANRARTEIAKTGIASYWATNAYLYMEKDHGFEVRFGSYILQILPVTGMRKSTDGGSTWSYL